MRWCGVDGRCRVVSNEVANDVTLGTGDDVRGVVNEVLFDVARRWRLLRRVVVAKHERW